MSPALPREERVSTVSLRAIALSDPQDTAKTGALALMARLAADELDATRDALDAAEEERDAFRDLADMSIRRAVAAEEENGRHARAEVAALRGRIEGLRAVRGEASEDGGLITLRIADLVALLAADEGERTGR